MNLKYFSLVFRSRIFCYDLSVVPLLQRMSNLEELHLSLQCYQQQSLIDGNHLKDNILRHLSHLRIFQFNICSFVDRYDRLNLLSNQYIRNTFQNFPTDEIVSSIDYFPEENRSQCHAYSLPYTLTTYERITNHFSGGLFVNVCQISLFDEKPFEHEFFIRIQKSFPFVNDLTVFNTKAQANNQNNFQLIHYPHLRRLWLCFADESYVEQFLLSTKSALPFNLNLYVGYEVIRRVTHDFKRFQTRINSSKINCIYEDRKHQFSKDFLRYFLTTEYM